MSTIFTRIIEGSIPGTFVYRDEQCVVFMSINPITDGHVLVVPIQEVDHWVDLSPELSAHLFAISHRMSLAIQKAFPCERMGLIIAGYEINHCHIHLIPTHSMADLSSNAASSVPREVLESHAARIQEQL
jgi:histidine triad (HIT) family protein